MLDRRNDGERVALDVQRIVDAVREELDIVHRMMYEKARNNMTANTYEAETVEEADRLQKEHGGFIRTKWCGALECELAMKETTGMSSRCMPLEQSGTKGRCVCCGKECTTDIYWGISY